MADLLGGDFALAEKNALYRCLDKLFPQRGAVLASAPALAGFVRGAVRCVAVRLDEHLFHSARPDDEADKRRHGYSRDKRSDCVQVVIALIVTPDGFPLGYEVLAGNTSDKTTLRGMLRKIEAQYGKANRIWVMDRGIPTEEVLAEVRAADPPLFIWSEPPRGGSPNWKKLCSRSPGKLSARAWTSSFCAGPGTLRAGAKPRAYSQGTCHAPAQAQVAMGAPQANLGHGPRSRGTAHEARRRTWPGAGGVASDRHRSGSHSATFSFALDRKNCAKCGGAKDVVSCAPTCVDGSLPSCHSSISSSSRSRRPSRPCRTICNCARSTINSKSASRRTSSSPSWPYLLTSRCAHGSNRWRRPHAAGRARQACCRANARRKFPDDGWPHLGHAPLHRVGARAKAPGQATQLDLAPNRRRASPRQQRQFPSTPPPCSVYSAMRPLILLTFSASEKVGLRPRRTPTCTKPAHSALVLR